jgi:hypothetical protein
MLITFIIDSFQDIESLANSVNYIKKKCKKIDYEILIQVSDGYVDLKQLLGYVYENRLNIKLFIINSNTKEDIRSRANGELIVRWVDKGKTFEETPNFSEI